MNPPVYLDYQATTPIAPEVAAAMRPWIESQFGNPHSQHRLGREASAAIEVARDRILATLKAPVFEPELHDVTSFECNEKSPGKLFFTAGATEAANWALKGAAARLPVGRRRIVTLATEHACILDTVHWLGQQGFDIDVVPVGSDGLVDLALLAGRVTPATGLIAAMLVNNEIGVIQPVAEIATLARAQGALVFCDAVQGLGRVTIPLGVCDLVAISAHKVHGPKGVGALWIRKGVAVDPLLHGGGQEGGLRSGTLAPALCVGFGEAARLLGERAAEDHRHVGRLWARARALLPDWRVNGSESARYRGNLNLRRDGLDAGRLLSELRSVALSAGSACASGSGRPSHVLSALGLGDREARSSIRLGFGRYTSEDELVRALTLINDAADRQRSFAA